jgi:extracellular matrix regulatory protein A
MDYNLLNVGFGSTIVAEQVIAILAPNSAPMRRLKDEAKDEQRLIDATHGRRTRSIVITKTNHIILSSIQSETLSQRFMSLRDREPLKTKIPV